ncbi:unnamed protein product, partial [Vitrella brassicaformis CCMP3155]
VLGGLSSRIPLLIRQPTANQATALAHSAHRVAASACLSKRPSSSAYHQRQRHGNNGVEVLNSALTRALDATLEDSRVRLALRSALAQQAVVGIRSPVRPVTIEEPSAAPPRTHPHPHPLPPTTPNTNNPDAATPGRKIEPAVGGDVCTPVEAKQPGKSHKKKPYWSEMQWWEKAICVTWFFLMMYALIGNIDWI